MTTTKTLRRAGRVARAACVTLALAACSNAEDRLLGVETPDIVTPENASSVAGAQSFYVAANGDFARLVGGDRGGSSPLGLNLTGGMLADEIFSARAGTEHLDNRSINPNTFPIDSWTQVGNTWSRNMRALRLLLQYPPATGKEAQLAQLHANMGFTLTLAAEHYCNGIPIWDGKDELNPKTATMSTEQMYAAAVSQFDSAITIAGTGTGTAAVRNIASIGKARALLNMAKTGSLSADMAKAADAARQVPTNFVWNTLFSKNTTGVANAIYNWMLSTRNFGASDREGGNGLDFVSARDPRAKVAACSGNSCRGQDGSNTPTLNQYPTLDAPVPIATGVEARLIEAEARLAAGDGAGMMQILNDLRAATGSNSGGVAGLAPLADPGSQSGRVDLLFRERAFWMYMTAHRLGDLRRLVRQYGREVESVFPTGAYFKGGRYGTDVTLLPSQAETNNPDWKECTDRKA
jgi:hypothetical protein